MQSGARAFVNSVCAIGIFHEIDGFIEFDQAVEQQLAAGGMDVVVAGTVNEQQVSLQALREING